jgi:hypothetical protein
MRTLRLFTLKVSHAGASSHLISIITGAGAIMPPYSVDRTQGSGPASLPLVKTHLDNDRGRVWGARVLRHGGWGDDSRAGRRAVQLK